MKVHEPISAAPPEDLNQGFVTLSTDQPDWLTSFTQPPNTGLAVKDPARTPSVRQRGFDWEASPDRHRARQRMIRFAKRLVFLVCAVAAIWAMVWVVGLYPGSNDLSRGLPDPQDGLWPPPVAAPADDNG